MIQSFRCKDTEKIFNLERSKKFPSDIHQVALRKLRMINRSITLADLRIPPANRLEKLRGNRSGHWSIRINNQWRTCFDWKDGHSFNVEIVDYR
ncbi:MAG: type II toxin-antitoxin system RelE/ParE family toxin [bacterium]|nr:type II toxin-antitoxin system RelE/ParE family toxin [bacterium]